MARYAGEDDEREELFPVSGVQEGRETESFEDWALALTWFDRQGNPVGLFGYVALMMQEGYQRVGETMIGRTRVSTVWTGVPGNLCAGPALIFETMVFGAGGSACARRGILYRERYATEAGALAGHDRAVAWVREGMPGREGCDTVA